LHPTITKVTDRIIARSKNTREKYLSLLENHKTNSPRRTRLAAANQAHTYAACPAFDKGELIGGRWPNIGIVTAFNDMLSAHQPFEKYPDLIKNAARNVGATAQVAGGVPAMCDGVTQGFEGMELSLFSRDIVALSTAIALSHDAFDAAIYLGVCDKIVPGLVIGALRFGYLPAIFCPAGPMTSGISNSQKAKTRQLFAEGKVGREALLESESQAYHDVGTCTFYGTANSNQMMMEMLGLHLPSSAFFNPNTPIRTALVKACGERAAKITHLGDEYIPIAKVISEKSIVNAIVGLCATGGSTNHMLHLPAMAAAAGVLIDWQDFEEISECVPLLARVYPNGGADVNHFHAAGGMAYLINELLQAGLAHNDVWTAAGYGLEKYTQEPFLDGDLAIWHDGAKISGDENVLRPIANPFATTGGLRLVKGNIGRACVKISAVAAEHQKIIAPARVFTSQAEFHTAFNNGELNQDVVVVVKGQGPKAIGMPELHKLTPALGILQDKGYKVALLTDGRMSGASGKILAAIHVTPEAKDNGAIGKILDGDIIEIDANGIISAHVDDAIWQARTPIYNENPQNNVDFGRELFAPFRDFVSGAENGASIFNNLDK
jgi:phosphogluconate dehydratase